MKRRKSGRTQAGKAYYAFVGASKKAVKRQKTVRAGSRLIASYREAMQELVKLLTFGAPIGALLEVEIPAGVRLQEGALKGLDWGFTLKRRHLDVLNRIYPSLEDLRIATAEVKMTGGAAPGIIDMNTGEVMPQPTFDLTPKEPAFWLKGKYDYAVLDAKLTARIHNRQYGKAAAMAAARRPAGAVK